MIRFLTTFAFALFLWTGSISPVLAQEAVPDRVEPRPDIPVEAPLEGEEEAPSRYKIELQEPIGDMKTVTGYDGLDLAKNYLSKVYTYALYLISLICVGIIIFSGADMIWGGIEPSMVSEAKTRILHAILSLVLLLISAAILKVVNPNFFGGDDPQPILPIEEEAEGEDKAAGDAATPDRVSE